MDRKIVLYRACPLQYEKGEAFLRYLEENRGLLHGRPQCMQHGDYHTGNMMLCGGRLFVIDFDRPDWGDPWEGVQPDPLVRPALPRLLQRHGGGLLRRGPPLAFWRLLALYIANNTLGSLPWAIPFGEGEIATMKKQAAEILLWYDNLKNPVPRWYAPE